MSGGHFDYSQYKLTEIADSIETAIRNNEDESRNEFGDIKGTFYNANTLAEFCSAIHFLRIAQIYAQRVDWLLSGDDGEESFHDRLRSDLVDLYGAMKEPESAK